MSQKKNSRVPLSSMAIDVRHRILLDEASRTRPGGGTYHYFEGAVRGTINSLRLACGALETMTWKTARMRELCEYGFICNASLCRTLVQEQGLPWRTAHQITAIMTRRAQEQGMEMADVTPEFLDECATKYVGYGKPLSLTEEKLKEAFSVENSVHSTKSHGGTAPERVKEQITTSREGLKQDRASVIKKRNRLQAAAEKLEKAIEALIGT